jgi:hypothetical protein
MAFLTRKVDAKNCVDFVPEKMKNVRAEVLV